MEPVSTIDFNKYQDESKIIEGFWMDIQFNITTDFKETEDADGNDVITDIE